MDTSNQQDNQTANAGAGDQSATSGAQTPVTPLPPANFQLGEGLPAEFKIKIPEHTLKLDNNYFLRLLAGSLSLSKIEKKKIIETVPKLRQEQVDELIRIFEEEKEKFAALDEKHVPELSKMSKSVIIDWLELEAEVEQEAKKADDAAKAEEIRKSLGL